MGPSDNKQRKEKWEALPPFYGTQNRLPRSIETWWHKEAPSCDRHPRTSC